MSEIADTPATVTAPGAPGTPVGAAVQTVHEAYSFACMRCAYVWEQDYAIEHHVDGKGEPFIMYKVAGERVPSPLSNPTCHNCGGHVVRIMRAGQVSSVLGMLDQLYHHRIAPGIAGPVPAGADVPRPPKAHRPPRTHDAPGPVAIDEAEKNPGLLSRLLGIFRRS